MMNLVELKFFYISFYPIFFKISIGFYIICSQNVKIKRFFGIFFNLHKFCAGVGVILELQKLLGTLCDVNDAVFRCDDHILNANTVLALDVNAGLYRDNVANLYSIL